MSSKKGQAKSETKQEHKTKKFGNGERSIPHHTHKAKKFYPAEDEAKPKKTRKSIHAHTPRPSLTPGTVLIILAGRFRGKRVILLRNLDQGICLVTGPFKVNGVPLRRVNARYVIGTKSKVEMKGLDEKTIGRVSEEGYFTREKKEQRKAGEEAFFKQGTEGGKKAEKKAVSGERAKDQKAVDKALLAGIKETPLMREYLASSFSLRKGDKPHEMVF